MTQRECELVRRLTDTLERMHLDDYLEYVSNRRRMLGNNFLYGMARGLGFAGGRAFTPALKNNDPALFFFTLSSIP